MRSTSLALGVILLSCCARFGSLCAADQASAPRPSLRDQSLPGLVSEPRKLPGIGRWQLARKSPRGRILAIAWNADGNQIAFSDHSYVRLCDAQQLETKRILAGHASEVTGIDWNHHTNRIASSSCDGTVRIWTGDGVPEKILSAEAGEVKAVAWTRDGARLAAACERGIICIWNADGFGKQTVQASKSAVNCIAWSPADSSLVSGDNDGQVKLWTAETKLMRTCDGFLSSVQGVAWSPDGRHFAAATFGEEEPNTERQHSEFRVYAADGSSAASNSSERLNSALGFSPDGQQVALNDPDKEIRICDLHGAEVDHLAVRAFGISVLGGMAWSPKRREIAAGGAGVVTVVNLADTSQRTSSTGQAGQQTARPDPIALSSRDGEKWLVQLSNGDPFQVWTASEGNHGPKFPEVEGQAILHPAWNAAGDQIAFVDRENRLRVWRVGSPESRLILEAASPIVFLAWSPQGDVLTSLDQTGELRAGREDGSNILKTHINPPTIDYRSQCGASLLESPVLVRADGKSIAVFEQNNVQLIPLDGTPPQVLRNEKVLPGSWSIDCWWSTDGLRLTGFRRAGHDFQLATRHLQTGQRATLGEFPDEVTAIDCSPDGNLALIGFDNGFWQLRRLDNLAAPLIESEPAVHLGTIRSVAFSGDSRRFATGGWDGLIRIWSCDGKLEQTLYGNDWPVYIVKWNSDGRRLTSVSRDHTTILWSLKTGRPELTFKTSGGRVRLLTRDGRIFGPSPAQLDEEFLGLVEKPSRQMEIVNYSDLLKPRPGR